MPHVTFVHGIGNKPEAAALLGQWCAALLDNEGVDLAAYDVSTSMVYWADVLHATPALANSGNEAALLELVGEVDAGHADLSWLARVSLGEQAFVRRLGEQVGLVGITADPLAPPDIADTEIAVASALEALPLPMWLKKRLMSVFLREVHHYLWDVDFSPRPGTSYRVRDEIRARTRTGLWTGHSNGGPHVVLAHSLGSVIAYDVLSDAADAPPIDALITVGSPLGLSEIQAALAPPWTSRNGWPSVRIPTGTWANVSDALDPVCGLDRRIAGDFRREGAEVVKDVSVTNHGSWRHSISKYLTQPPLRQHLLDALGLD